MIELFSGHGGVARAFRAAGWETLTVDNDPRAHPDVLADVEAFIYDGPPLDFVWASPPCTTFSLAHYMAGRVPSGAGWPLVAATRRKILAWKPEHWIIENVEGMVAWWPAVRQRAGSWCLWGHFPYLDVAAVPWKNAVHVRNPRERGRVPVELARAVVRALDEQPSLWR